MRKKQTIRTGIDLGTSSVKLVRGTGADRLENITHVGCREWETTNPVLAVEKAAEALRGLLEELGLGRGDLGRVIASVGGAETSMREASLPYMTPEEFRSSLPFEGRKYLSLDNLESPVLDGQIIETVEPDGDTPGTTLALLAASSMTKRTFVTDVLAECGVEPEVITVEPLARLNSMINLKAPESHDVDRAVALLDLGAKRANLIVAYYGTGLLSREIWRGDQPADTGDAEAAYIRDIATRTLETLTFYRGRYRREVDAIYLTGGSALKEGRAEELGRIMNRDVVMAKPFGEIAGNAVGVESHGASEAMFVTACGLARAEDEGYRINLYPEYADKRSAAKRRTGLTAALAAVAGIQAFVIGSLVLNAQFLDSKIDSVSAELPRLEEYIQTESVPREDLVTARELVELRRNRVDWAPKLAALSHAVTRNVKLVKLEGRRENADSPATLAINGEAKVDSKQLERVSAFLGRLREDDAFGPSFASITLGNVKADINGGFDVNCRTGEEIR